MSVFINLVASERFEVNTIAGDGTDGFLDGEGKVAKFSFPYNLVNIDSNIYVSDSGNNRIRKIDKSGKVATIAGDGTDGFLDGDGKVAKFSYPCGITSDGQKTIYVADTFNNRVRKIILGHGKVEVSTVAGIEKPGFANGHGKDALFNYPFGLTYNKGKIYVADSSSDQIRKVDESSEVTTFAGNEEYGFADAHGHKAKFSYPCGITSDPDGNLYVADTMNRLIRKVSHSGMVSTIAGSHSGFAGRAFNTTDFRYPYGVACDSIGNVYVADTNNHKILKIYASGKVATIAGSGICGDADGHGSNAQFNAPYGIACDSTGKNIYVADTMNHKIRHLMVVE